MKLLELEIINIRGIQHLLVKPNGKNFLFFGPNGSGKSSVIDALDFLLSGKITRLCGQGTGAITLRQHGVRLTTEAKDATVRGVFKIEGYDKPIQIMRNMKQPDQIDCEPSERSFITPALIAASRGQYVLTRRDILHFITAEPNERTQQIQALLNLADIEATRKCLVSVKNHFDTQFNIKQTSLDNIHSRINVALGINSFENEEVLRHINLIRKTLGGVSLTSLHSTSVKSGIRPVVLSSPKIRVNVVEVKNAQQALSASFSAQAIQARQETINSIRASVDELRSDSELSAEVARLDLTEKGLALLDESGKCPLCDFPWKPGELRKSLEARLAKASRAQELAQLVSQQVSALRRDIQTPLSAIDVMSKAAELLKTDVQRALLEKWAIKLDNCHKSLLNVIDNYEKIDFGSKGIVVLLQPDGWSDNCQTVLNASDGQSPPISPEQAAWDNLTRLEVRLDEAEVLDNQLRTLSLFRRRASTILREFASARDNTLRDLYSQVETRFKDLYRKIHSSDEAAFDAEIVSSGPGTTLKVDFYGHGKHVPHALHSEGHQDSMGVCLFIALSEAANQELLNIMVLDDVVMSVDSEHRKQLANLFSSQMLNRQLLITTHDRNWFHELRSYGVITYKSFVEFSNWKLETGPVSTSETDVWSFIASDLARNDVSGAAGRLRRWLEFVANTVCDSLCAKVPFKADGRFELGDLLPAAISQFRDLLRKAKSAAQSWKRNADFEELSEIESVANQIFARAEAEKWSINPSVHFSRWADLSSAEFETVVQAFHDLCNLFACGSCGGWLHVTKNENRMESIRCNCPKCNWNLVPPKN